MTTIELFSGTKSFSKVMAAHGHATFTFDNDPALNPDKLIDMRMVKFIERVDMLWASPPCQGFSVAVIGRNWNHDNTPKTDSARLAMELAKTTLRLIGDSSPAWWFIENPRGKLRKMPWLEEWVHLQGGVRHTIWYCRYGDSRAKPTDIWTNATWWRPRPECHNGSPDHEAAPRGAKTGTQGLQGAMNRGVIPPALFEEILEQMPKQSHE